jgi:hypothetical protein
MRVLLEQEHADWKWSLLFCAVCKLSDLPLRYRGRPFAHMAKELDDIICWASEQLLPSFGSTLVPVAVLSLKRISRATVGPFVALAWPRNFTKEKNFIMEYLAELKFAAVELMTFGHTYFPGLLILAPDLVALRDGIEPGTRVLSNVAWKQLSSAAKWLDMLVVHAVVDMMRGGEQDHLTGMWTFGVGLPWASIEVSRHVCPENPAS